MEFFRIDQLGCITEGGPNVLLGHIVFPDDLLICHSSRKTPYNAGDGNASATDNWLAMLNLGIYYNSVIHGSVPANNFILNDTGLESEFEITLAC